MRSQEDATILKKDASDVRRATWGFRLRAFYKLEGVFDGYLIQQWPLRPIPDEDLKIRGE